MGANRSGEKRKLHQKRSLKNWRTGPKKDSAENVLTIRGAIFRRKHPEGRKHPKAK
jgi:hypothetical protein